MPRVGFGAQVWYHCRISPPRFLAECHKRRLNQGSFVVLYFNFSALSDLYFVFACLFSCTVFVFSYCMFIFLYCFVCQYRSSDWLWRPPPKWPKTVSGGALNSAQPQPQAWRHQEEDLVYWRSSGREFNSRPVCCQVTILGKLLTLNYRSVTKQLST